MIVPQRVYSCCGQGTGHWGGGKTRRSDIGPEGITGRQAMLLNLYNVNPSSVRQSRSPLLRLCRESSPGSKPRALIIMLKALANMHTVARVVSPPCVMVRRGWLGDDVGDATNNCL